MATPPKPAAASKPIPAPPARASAEEEAIARSIFKAHTDNAAAGDISFAPPEEAYDIASQTALSTPPQEEGLAARLKKKQREQGRRASVWVYAPSTSHISRFMLVKEENVSRIQVVFKGPDGSGEVAEYAYHFTDHGTASSIFDQLRGSPHPYGQILFPKVIRGGVPYTPVSI